MAIIGAPNAGKSTLLNRLVGARVAIVTRKAQTTRTRITGIAIEGSAQIVFLDTPGIFAPKRRLDRAMVAAAWHGAADADLTLLLVDANTGLTDEVARIATGLRERKTPAKLVLNKIDLIKRPKLLELTSAIGEVGDSSDTYMISALDGDGVDDLMATLASEMPEGPWLYPGDQVADVTERLLAAEITRGQIYERLHQELPYASAVETEAWEERKDGSVKISQIIYVQSKSQKPIFLGKGGRTIKDIGAAARVDMEELLGRKVHLFLFVKVKENWADDPGHYRSIGLEFPK